MDGVHPRLAYLAMALAVERGPRPNWKWKPADNVATGTPGNLRAIWRLAARGRWAKWVVDDSKGPGWNLGTCYVALSSLLTLLLGVSLVTRALGWGDVGVPWSSMAIAVWLLLGFVGGFTFCRIQKKDIGETLVLITIGVLLPVPALHGVASELFTVVPRPGQYKLIAISPIIIHSALFFATPAGNLTHLLLGLITILVLLAAQRDLQTLTHPAVSSDATAKLVGLLHDFRQDSPRGP